MNAADIVAQEPEFVDEGVIRCICGTIEDDGFTIQCEKCFVWQHAVCVDITQDTVPDIYFCENCNPRTLDYEKAAAIQQKRLKEERKKARLEKQSPRKRKESSEFPSDFGTRKRTKDHYNDDILSPRKRIKEGLLDSPGRGLSGDYSADDWGNQSRGRLFLQDQFYSFTQLPIREPIIKKKDFPKTESDGKDLSPYDSEYSCFLNDFSRLSNTHKFTPQVYQYLKDWLELSKSFPLAEILDPFAESDLPDDWVFQPCSSVALLSSSKPWTLNGYYGSVSDNQSDNLKQMGFFASVDLNAGSFVADIKGTICSSVDLDLAESRLSVNPVMNLNHANVVESLGKTEKSFQILPPFVFPFPIAKYKENLPSFFVDAREFGDFDGRFIRFSCGSPDSIIPNAELRVVVVIDEFEIGDRPMYGRTVIDPSDASVEAPLFPITLTDRFKLCIFTSRKVFKGDEIVLANTGNLIGFPCSCNNKETCTVFNTLERIKEYQEIANGIEMDTDNLFFDLMRERENEKKALRSEQSDSQLVPSLIWNYSIKASITVEVENEAKSVVSENECEDIKDCSGDEKLAEASVNGDAGRVDESNDEVFEPETKIEPEKPSEPKRVNFMDFMKRLSTAPSVEAALSSDDIKICGSNEEKKEDLPFEPEIKVETPLESEKSIQNTQEITRISLNSSSIKAFASSLTKEVDNSKESQKVVQNNQIELRESSPSISRTSTPVNLSITDTKSFSAEKKELENTSKNSPSSSVQETSISIEVLEKHSWRDDRSYRERRESEPMYPFARDARGDHRDTIIERSRSVRESYPPPRYRGSGPSGPFAPGSLDIPQDGDHHSPRNRPYSRDPSFHSMAPREFRPDPRDGPSMPPSRDYRSDSRDLSRDYRLDPREGPSIPPPRDGRGWYSPSDYRRGRGRGGGYSERGGYRSGHEQGPYDSRYSREFRPDPRDGPPPPDRDLNRSTSIRGGYYREKMGCIGSKPVSPDLAADAELRNLTIKVCDGFGIWKATVLEFSDALETFQLGLAHWVNREENEKNLKSAYLDTFNELSTLATKLYIASRPFSQAIDLYKGYLKDEVMSRLKELSSDKKSSAKTKDTLVEFRRRHPQVYPYGGAEKVKEQEGGGELARLLNLETHFRKKIDDHFEAIYVELTVSLVFHLHEIIYHYGAMWKEYGRIFREMLDLFTQEEFISSQARHEAQTLKKNVIAKIVAQQDEKRQEIENMINFSKKIVDTWVKLLDVQVGAVSILQNWVQMFQKTIPVHELKSTEQSSIKLKHIQDLMADWSQAVSRRTISSHNEKNTANRMNLIYSKLEKKLKELVSFFDQICRRNDDVKRASKEAFEISRTKGTKNIYYEKAEQKVEAVVKDNRKFVLLGLSSIESHVFSSILDTSVALSAAFNSISENFQNFTVSAPSPTVENDSLNEIFKVDSEGIPSRSQSVKKIQNRKDSVISSVPSTASNILSSQASYADISILLKPNGSRRIFFDLAKEPSSPNHSIRKVSVPSDQSMQEETQSFHKHGEKPPPPIPITRFKCLNSSS